MTICNKYPRELTHYDRQLKKNCFRKLKDNVWESKTKWWLLLKAQRSYHNKLIRSSFYAWRTFTTVQRQKKKKLENAIESYAKKVKFRVFSTLKYNVEPLWELQKRLDIVHNLKLMKRSWNQWRKYVGKSLRSKEIDLLIRKMRELYLVRTFIQLWFVNYNGKIFAEVNYLRAVTHHNIILLRRFFIALRNYRIREYYKKELISHLSNQFELKLKRKFFVRLLQYTKHRKLYEKHVQCVALFYEKYLVKNVIDRWNVKYEDMMESRNRENYSIAVKFHEESLLGKYFSKLKTWSNNAKSRNDASNSFIILKIRLYLDIWMNYHREKLISDSMEEKALQWRVNKLKFIYLMKVMESLEEKRSENEKIKKFITFSDDRLRKGYFRKWRKFSFVKREKKLNFHRAEKHYDVKIIRKSFRLLCVFSYRQIRKLTIVNYNNRKILSKSFDALKCYYRFKRSRRDCVEKFQERCRSRLLRRAFHILYDKTKKNRDKSLVVKGIADCKTKRKIFALWKKFHEVKTLKKNVINNGRHILQDILIRNVMRQWWKKTQVRTSFKEELRKFKGNQDRRLVVNYLRKWMNLMEKLRLLREKCRTFGDIYVETILEYYLSAMIHAWIERKITKEKEDLALSAERELLLRRYFNRWVTYVEWKREKLRECSERIFRKPEQCSWGLSETKLRRKQPMIPQYLREQLLYIQEESASSGNDTYDVSSPVSENLPVINVTKFCHFLDGGETGKK